MQKIFGTILLMAFVFIFCGAPPEDRGAETKTGVKTEETGQDIIYQKLSESEIQRFIKVYPIARTEIEKAGKRLDLKKADSPLQGFSNLAALNKEIAGLDAKMRAAGMSWEEFWPVFSKTWFAVIAVKMGDKMDKSAAEMEKQLKDPKIPEAQKKLFKEVLENLKKTREMYAKVPQENKDLVEKYWDQLSGLFDID
ncbi:MAG TPA: hypothetical protein ENI34_03015 [candidate division WOR-3 bacterium]|uniref:Uncharacterized protein n=1 Tax=candidate division WOR-3 bacterium TaxID=2052148 RepID=A0A9C9EM65_UNCW3|nr:hypothetical protein [candidate division WOR-3 bacterium]